VNHGDDWIETVKQIARYEKRRPKKYRSSGWRYYDSYYRGAKYGKTIPETGYMYYTTQAWSVLKKCWVGFKIAKAQDDFEKIIFYAEGIQKAQKELNLPVENFPNLDLCDDSGNSRMGPELRDRPSEDDNDNSYGYESEAQRKWREKMEQPYESPAQKGWRENSEIEAV
jgi:hypothetical protein